MHERIRSMREDRDISQKEMAAFLHVAQTTYSDYERGKVNIPVNILKKLAAFYGTSIDYLLELTDCPQPYPAAKKE